MNRAQYIIHQIEEVLPAFDKAAMSPRAIGTTRPKEPSNPLAPKSSSGGDKGFGPMPTQSDAATRQEKQDKKSALDWSGVYSR